MKALLLTLLLCFAAAAQTITGLPQYGVQLGGTFRAPVVTNNSGKRIIAVTARFEDTVHKRPVLTVSREFLYSIDAAFTDGRSCPIKGLRYPGDPISTAPGDHDGAPTINAADADLLALDSVTFADGEFAGPDKANRMAKLSSLLATVKAAALPDASAWSKYSQLVASGSSDTNSQIKAFVASQILIARSEKGDNEGSRLIQFLISIPTLRRVQ
jgi:hypothetical protein